MNFETGLLKKIVVHYAGSRNNMDQVVLSGEEFSPAEEERQLLQEAFLTRFKAIPETYCFCHHEALQYNEMFRFSKQIFDDEESFITVSQSITRHLSETSVHPRIQGGELYLLYYDALLIEGRKHKAIGIFKSENKMFFLDAQHKRRQISLRIREGVEVSKIDKGCLVIDRDEESGFEVLIFDQKASGDEARYWREDFLGLKMLQTEYSQTQQFLSLTRQFITTELEEVPKTRKLELLNQSIDYFKTREAFDIEEFQKEVFADEDLIGSFKHFGSKYTTVHDVDIAAGFDISQQAVKKQSKIFKSIVKLDKNFHIYIHGRADLIEKGVEADGRKFYKLYYNDES